MRWPSAPMKWLLVSHDNASLAQCPDSPNENAKTALTVARRLGFMDGVSHWVSCSAPLRRASTLAVFPLPASSMSLLMTHKATNVLNTRSFMIKRQ